MFNAIFMIFPYERSVGRGMPFTENFQANRALLSHYYCSNDSAVTSDNNLCGSNKASPGRYRGRDNHLSFIEGAP